MESGQGPRNQDQTTGDAGGTPSRSSERERRFAASRLRPRVEISRTPQPRRDRADQADPGREPTGERPILAEPVEDQQPLFGQPREFAGGRVRVYGCSPGCLIASLVVSLILSCLLTALVNGGF